ncbi:MAG: hypothetical protein ACRCWQ_11865, partial [Bacilli bacterium]
FKKLNGKKIELSAYMGEILELKDGWFLAIEQPGGECPFCSADGNFWNKIAVVYVKEKQFLRYVPEQMKITGTLDVGVRKDETGFKTMFRIYHAEFSAN